MTRSSQNGRIHRRSVLKAATAAFGFPWIVRASALGAGSAVAPSNRITVGCIGVGGQGLYDMGQLLALPDVQVVAVCDPKRDRRDKARQIVNEHYKGDACAAYNDFRELVARPDIDAVQIASTDHWHVLHALAAVRAGKDIYVEKPLGMSIQEAKVLRAACHRYGRRFQFGTQQRSSPQFRQACELAINGRLGKLRAIKVSAPVGVFERTGNVRYTPAPVPEGFDYEMWLGPAPAAPYTPKRCVSPFWFHISDYSLGYIAGWGIHHIDIAQWGNGTELTGPTEIEASGVFPAKDSLCDNPLSWDATMKYANGVILHFTSDGGPIRHGVRFEGDRGWVHVDRGSITAEPASLLREKIGPGEIQLPVSTNHQRNWIDCVKTRAQPICNIDVAVRTETVCQLTWLAVHLGRKLKWDPVKEEFVKDPEANARLVRAMRAPWHL
ncbi:MAG TPA: Gfo/Idh/MocA family oxidoreductase [Phycisphaerae bacterium]|nr:Gfo/Idh/MocA family oxidoreductase [Phycisphaerae bacterium]HOJ74505.1 Gfo/Idh/MocA family oxidoreductase [Phycisphaerae bacterium]HOM53255.1 Gfo/Idh/MocA family oxidoreductase [Phycisphaerae bacterium]HPP28366.1 Gfo/Idh/MocA family oxidoreductase [Phycisphaerae bacterium]HPZ99134.1 Gfo/Idh/MocA family oxidoreductase [Phycisphaerae bacterium]